MSTWNFMFNGERHFLSQLARRTKSKFKLGEKRYTDEPGVTGLYIHKDDMRKFKKFLRENKTS